MLLLLLSPFIGSFLGVLIQRLPMGAPIALDRSRCNSCGHTLGPRDLVPLLSFVASRGRCRHCAAPIGWFHPCVELASLALAGLIVLLDPDPAAQWVDAGLGWTLLVLGWIDWRHMILPDVLTLPLLLAGLVVTAFGPFSDLTLVAEHALAAGLGWALLAIVAALYRRLRGREGLGLGDAKLYAAGCAWLGLDAMGACLLLAALLALCVAVPVAVRNRAAHVRVAFGPALAVSVFVLWVGRGFLL